MRFANARFDAIYKREGSTERASVMHGETCAATCTRAFPRERRICVLRRIQLSVEEAGATAALVARNRENSEHVLEYTARFQWSWIVRFTAGAENVSHHRSLEAGCAPATSILLATSSQCLSGKRCRKQLTPRNEIGQRFDNWRNLNSDQTDYRAPG